MDKEIKAIKEKINRGEWPSPEESKQYKQYETEALKNLIECNIYVDGVTPAVISRVFLHRKSGGFSKMPILAVRGEQLDVVKEIEYELNRIGFKQ